MLFLAAIALLAGGPPAADGLATVPGAVNTTITQDNIDTTICSRSWHGINPYTHKDVKGTGQLRPPVSFTNKIKYSLMAASGIPKSDAHLYELDHDISLEIGGNPESLDNLWLQPWDGVYGARKKDSLEKRMNKLVCNKTLTLVEAQTEISGNWVQAYHTRIGPLPGEDQLPPVPEALPELPFIIDDVTNAQEIHDSLIVE